MIRKQSRGCSKLFYAIATEAEDGTLTFGTPKQFAIVKSISRTMEQPSEKIHGDNYLVDEVFGGTTASRTFEVIGVGADIEAEVLGNTIVKVGDEANPILTSTAPSGANKPFVAFGYALHDGDADNPKELVWLYKCKVNSISKTASTIDEGTTSEGQSVEITAYTPRKKWTKTNRRELDLVASRLANETQMALWYEGEWFEKVITPDNAETELSFAN